MLRRANTERFTCQGLFSVKLMYCFVPYAAGGKHLLQSVVNFSITLTYPEESVTLQRESANISLSSAISISGTQLQRYAFACPDLI